VARRQRGTQRCSLWRHRWLRLQTRTACRSLRGSSAFWRRTRTAGWQRPRVLLKVMRPRASSSAINLWPRFRPRGRGLSWDRYDFPSVVFYTASLSVRTEVLRLLGGFDERIVPSDDTDLCSRILQAGWKIAYTAAARVGHRHRARIGVMLKRLYEYGTSRPRLLRKHSPRTCYVLVLGHQIVWRGAVTAHVNLTSPEKVCLGLAVLSAWEPRIAAGLVAYWAWLAAQLGRTARARGLEPRSWWELAVWTGAARGRVFRDESRGPERWGGEPGYLAVIA
jgi:hypothetical protein